MKCEKCGKEHDGSYGSGRFCSSKCARSYSTSLNREEVNKKISIGLRESDKVNHSYAEYLKNPKTCKICGKILQQRNITSYCINCIRYSSELANYRSSIGKNASARVKNRKYWFTRDKKSYAEKFWIEVLNNNNISYKHNYPVKVESANRHFYLDFYIIKNNKMIDLEIDGKQHEYEDRKAHDIARDKYLKKQNYLVYRIKWNEINSDSGKILMKSKIDGFLNFYNNL